MRKFISDHGDGNTEVHNGRLMPKSNNTQRAHSYKYCKQPVFFSIIRKSKISWFFLFFKKIIYFRCVPCKIMNMRFVDFYSFVLQKKNKKLQAVMTRKFRIRASRIRNFWSWHSSADMKPVFCAQVCAVSTWQRMVVEGRTFFLQWIFMRWLAILNRITTYRFTQLWIASLTAVSFFCNGGTHGVFSKAPCIITVKHTGKRERLHQSQYRSVNGLIRVFFFVTKQTTQLPH